MKKLVFSLLSITLIVVLAIIIACVAIFVRGPRDYNEDSSILKVKDLNEIKIVLGDDAIYLRDDFMNNYAKISSSHSCGVHFEGNLNVAELKKIPIKYNKKADGYRAFFDKPSNIGNEGVSFVELIINYRKHPSVHETVSDEYSKLHTVHRALQGHGWTLVTVIIEDKYGALEFNAKLDVKDDVTDAEFDKVANMLIEEYENAAI